MLEKKVLKQFAQKDIIYAASFVFIAIIFLYIKKFFADTVAATTGPKPKTQIGGRLGY